MFRILPYYFHAANFLFSKEVFRLMKNNNTVRALTEGAVMIALATVLSLIKIIDLPYGGSVTIASMLPVAIIAYRHGLGWGLLTSTVYAALQQLLSLSTLSYVTTWQSVIAVIMLDYVVAFAVIGLAGIFRRPIKNQALSLCLGCLLVSLLRYACHVVSGCTVWAGLSIPTEAAFIYSLSYNATFMLPETIILLVIAAYITSNINFTAKMPSRLIRPDLPQNLGWMAPVAGLVAVIAIILDTRFVFSKLQNADAEFDITGLADVNWVLVVAVTLVAILIITALLAIRSVLAKKSTT